MAWLGFANRRGRRGLHLAASLQPYFIVFAASACGLIIEIVAGRLLAPSIGVSLYTWTSIIGVVLAGISAGNYLGGRVADRFPSVTTLALILLAGGLSSLSVLPLVGLVSQAFQSLPIISRLILLTTTLFFLPSLILGMVTPVVVKLQLRDLASTGNVVGRIYALSTAGAIFGTFLTGFVLIQWIGTRSVLLGVSLVLVILALSLKDLWRSRWFGWSLLAVFVGVGSFSYLDGDLNGPCQRESSYYCIRIGEQEMEGRMVKTLALDWLLHSYVDLDDPSFLAYAYEKVFADVAAVSAQENPQLRVLFIGGGGYTMPRYLEVSYPQSTLEVIEIDPQVTAVAFQYLGLPHATNIVTYNQDARTKLPNLPVGGYDLVIGDAFNDLSVPYHLTTLQFNQQVKALLTDQGIYMVNVVDKLHTGRFLRAYVNTLQRTFPQVYVLRDDADWDSDRRYTYAVMGSQAPVDITALQEANLRAGRVPVAQLMPGEAFQAWQASRGNIVLTDDYVPVENLLAPLYLESR
jgi:predicted membrane-bound spermidine synthase